MVEQSMHYTYLTIRSFSGSVPTDLAVLCHYGETNDILFPSGLVELSSSRCKTVHTFLLLQLRKFLGFYQPFNQFSKMHLYWKEDSKYAETRLFPTYPVHSRTTNCHRGQRTPPAKTNNL